MRLTELVHSTYFRFAALLTAIVLITTVVAGLIAFRAINVDLENRVIQAAEYSSQSFEELYEVDSRTALIAAVAAKSDGAKPDDEIYWLGKRNGERLAGRDLSDPVALSVGEVRGEDISAEAGDRYRVAIRDFDDLRVITILNFDVAEAIANTVLRVFAIAGLFLLALAGTIVVLLSNRAARRFGHITSTLDAAAGGQLNSRIELSGANDDIDQLASKINAALAQLETTVEGIRQVGANIAHDLRTPINRLGIQLEQLRSSDRTASDFQDRLDATTNEIHSITSTFDALLRISQIEAGARRVRFQQVSLSDIARTIHEAYAAVAEENEQMLKLSIATQDGGRIHGDKDLITQALANLTENALQHCPPGSTVYLEIGEGGRGAWLSVSDNGPGVPENERLNILKRFYRLDKSRATPGSGLGLALVKAISDLHGANLCLRDNDPGLSIRVEFGRFTNRGQQHA